MINLKIKMAPRKGFEPSTYRLTAERSTVELSRNIIIFNYNGIITYKYKNSIGFLYYSDLYIVKNRNFFFKYKIT